jgi:hypothetical protein
MNPVEESVLSREIRLTKLNASSAPKSVLVGRLVVLMAVISTAGCFPYRYTLRPGVSGRVVDSRSADAIANATVAVRSRDFHHQTGELILHTRADGSFALAPKQHWSIYIIPMDVLGPWTSVTISAPEYASQTLQLTSSAMGPKQVALGEIRLKKSP